MKFFLWLSAIIASTVALDSKSVNVALETSFSFDPKEKDRDRSFIADLRNFLEKVEHLLSDKSSTKHPKHRDSAGQLKSHVHLALRTRQSQGILTNFLLELATIVLNLNDQDLITLIKSLELETKRSFVKDPIFHQIVFDPRLKSFVRNSLKDWSTTPPKILKDNLKSFVENEENTTLNNFGRVLNGFYDKQDEEQMKIIINKIRSIPKRVELLEIVRNALNSIVYERYKKLNGTSKSAVGEEVSKLANYVGKYFKTKSHDPIYNFRKSMSSKEFTDSEREDIVFDLDDSLQKNTYGSMESEKNKKKDTKITDMKEKSWKHITDSLELIRKRIRESKKKKEEQTNIRVSLENDQYQQNVKESLESEWNRKKATDPKQQTTEYSIKNELTRENSKHSLEIKEGQKNIKESIENQRLPRNLNYFINSIDIEDKNMNESIEKETQQEMTKGSKEVNQNIKERGPQLKNSQISVEVNQNQKEYNLYQIVKKGSMELNQNKKHNETLEKNTMSSFEINLNMKDYKPPPAFKNGLLEIEPNRDTKEKKYRKKSKQKNSKHSKQKENVPKNTKYSKEKVSVESESAPKNKDLGSSGTGRRLNLNLDKPLEIDLDKSLQVYVHDDETPRNTNGIDLNESLRKAPTIDLNSKSDEQNDIDFSQLFLNSIQGPNDITDK